MDEERDGTMPPGGLVEKYEGMTTSHEAKRYIGERIKSITHEDLKEYGTIKNFCKSMLDEMDYLTPTYKKKPPIAMGTLNHFLKKEEERETYIGIKTSKIRDRDF